MTSTEPLAQFSVGDLVEAIPPWALVSGSGIYSFAVIVSLDPFVAVSEAGDMLWRATIKPEKVRAIGRATERNLKTALDRWSRERELYDDEPVALDARMANRLSPSPAPESGESGCKADMGQHDWHDLLNYVIAEWQSAHGDPLYRLTGIACNNPKGRAEQPWFTLAKYWLKRKRVPESAAPSPPAGERPPTEPPEDCTTGKPCPSPKGISCPSCGRYMVSPNAPHCRGCGKVCYFPGERQASPQPPAGSQQPQSEPNILEDSHEVSSLGPAVCDGAGGAGVRPDSRDAIPASGTPLASDANHQTPRTDSRQQSGHAGIAGAARHPDPAASGPEAVVAAPLPPEPSPEPATCPHCGARPGHPCCQDPRDANGIRYVPSAAPEGEGLDLSALTRPWYGQDIRDIITTHDKLLAYARQLEARLAEIVSIIAYQQQDLAEARALAKSRGEEVEKWKDDAMSANECLNMVADKLAQFGCEHGHGPEDTAPMFYPEWIDCVVRCAVQKARELLSSDLASSRAECERLAQLLKDQTACLKEEQDTSERLRGELAAAAAKLSPTDACDFQTAVKRVLSQVSELRSRIDNFHDALDDAGVPELDNNIYERTRWLSYQLAEARKRGEWQPIASAPKDGTQILGYFANGEQHVVGVWTQEASLGSVVECARELDGAKWTMPTHWLPLPPAPQGQPAPAEPPVENRVPSAGSPGDWVASLTKELREEIGEWMDGRVPEYRIEQLIRRHAPKPEREGGAR